MPEQPPFFIVGCPRSGTTLLQILVDSHPALAIPPESFLFDRFGPLFDTYGDFANPQAGRRLAEDLLSDRRIRDWNLPLTADALLSRAQPPSPAGLVDALFSAYAEAQGKRRWGDKTPQHALCIPAIRTVFPEARIIHLVRDGRDVAESTARIAIGPCSMPAIARRWQRYMDVVRDEVRSLPPGRFLEIRYEDLVRDPAATRARLLDFLGEDPALCPPLDQDLPRTGARERSTAFAHHASLRKAISAGKIGVYRTAFTPRAIELFESIAARGLTAHGYTPDFPAPRPATAAERLAAWLQDNTIRYLRKLWQPGAWRQVPYEIALAWQKFTRTRRRHA